MRQIERLWVLAFVGATLFTHPLDAQRDVLVSRTGDGAFWKWYGGPPVGPEFPGYQAGRFIGGSAGAVTGTQMIPINLNGDGYQDVLVFRSSDGAFWKWYGGGPALSPDFSSYHPNRYIGGSAGAVAGAQMIPINFNGDAYQDVLVFRSSDGAFWKWYGGGPAVSPDFSSYQPARYIGGSAGAVAGAQMIPINFNGDAYQDVLVFRSSDGAFWKWYGGGPAVSPDFSSYHPMRYIGGSAAAVAGAQMIPINFNGDAYRDVLVFRSSDGAFWKWYGGPGVGPDFSSYQPARYIGGRPRTVVGAQMIPMNFDCDPYQDVLVFRSSDGAFWKWYGGPGVGPDFSIYQPGRYIGGQPGIVPGARMTGISYISYGQSCGPGDGNRGDAINNNT